MQRIDEPRKEGHIRGRTKSTSGDLEIAHGVRQTDVGHTVAQGRDSAMHDDGGETQYSIYNNDSEGEGEGSGIEQSRFLLL